MERAVPSSRAPRAMRGAPLATALRELGQPESAAQRASSNLVESGTSEIAR